MDTLTIDLNNNRIERLIDATRRYINEMAYTTI